MQQIKKNQLLFDTSTGYLEEQITTLKSILSYGLGLSFEEIKVSFPSLDNFYVAGGIYKSSWALYTHTNKLPDLFYTGNFLIQGGPFVPRASRSPFGMEALSSLTSIANTFSHGASRFKQNWTNDLNLLFEENSKKLNLSVKEYQEFLEILNVVRAKWLLHLSEEGNYDFVVIEFSEPSDPLFFIDLENIDSLATKVKTYFKPISQKALNLLQSLTKNTEFEGRFANLQPGAWLRDDVLIEIENFYSEKISNKDSNAYLKIDEAEYFNNPFKIQSFRPT